ncbi:MAG TPA: ectonucleotide pyrophosphatase/phosphodiesterase [Pelobium sp.]|nr:ectonucleotide pyrophosphatase/phosphodiesterase [Pelobium sp.]
MKKTLLLLVSAFLTLQLYAQETKHVLLISIDGLRPEFYLEKGWDTPNMRNLMETGVYANGINSIFPSVTYPSHTTIITGAYPASHGVFYNAPRGAPNGRWYWESSLIKTKTLWDACKEAGLTTGSVMWPVTVGAPITWNFPVKRADADDKSDQLSVTKPLVTPTNLIDEMLNSGVISGNDDEFKYPKIDHTIGDMSAFILSKHKPNLMAVHFVGADHYQHTNGRESKQAHNAVALIDKEIGRLLTVLENEKMRANTTIIITGDHGFADDEKAFSPNVLLAKMNLLENKTAQAKFITPGGSAFLYVKDKKVVPSIVKMLNELPEDQKVFKIIDRKQLDAIGADPSASLALAFNKGVIGKPGNKGELLVDIKGGGNHGYFPDFNEIKTGFIINGAGVASHKEVFGLGIKDIAPLITDILELPFKAKDGKLFPNILLK